eukprot:m.245851 g.245851  ORF g.245851 m.245851 type:complete len:87 (-) comp26410_c0_seq9:223-483(-)
MWTPSTLCASLSPTLGSALDQRSAGDQQDWTWRNNWVELTMACWTTKVEDCDLQKEAGSCLISCLDHSIITTNVMIVEISRALDMV